MGAGSFWAHFSQIMFVRYTRGISASSFCSQPLNTCADNDAFPSAFFLSGKRSSTGQKYTCRLQDWFCRGKNAYGNMSFSAHVFHPLSLSLRHVARTAVRLPGRGSVSYECEAYENAHAYQVSAPVGRRHVISITPQSFHYGEFRSLRA